MGKAEEWRSGGVRKHQGEGERERFPTPRERRTFRPQQAERLRDDLCKQGVSENKHPRVIFAEGVGAGEGGAQSGRRGGWCVGWRAPLLPP